jgi:hypothetical protein
MGLAAHSTTSSTPTAMGQSFIMNDPVELMNSSMITKKSEVTTERPRNFADLGEEYIFFKFSIINTL